MQTDGTRPGSKQAQNVARCIPLDAALMTSLQTLLQFHQALSTWPMQTAGLFASMLKWFSSSSSCSRLPNPTCIQWSALSNWLISASVQQIPCSS